ACPGRIPAEVRARRGTPTTRRARVFRPAFPTVIPARRGDPPRRVRAFVHPPSAGGPPPIRFGCARMLTDAGHSGGEDNTVSCARTGPDSEDRQEESTCSSMNATRAWSAEREDWGP